MTKMMMEMVMIMIKERLDLKYYFENGLVESTMWVVAKMFIAFILGVTWTISLSLYSIIVFKYDMFFFRILLIHTYEGFDE